MKMKNQLKKLKKRQKDYDDRGWTKEKGYTRPGSQKKSGY